MEILAKILGSSARVKIMRLFLLNQTEVFTTKLVANKSRVSADLVRKEIRVLSEAGFIKKKGVGWSFDTSFKYAKEIEKLLVSADTLDRKNIVDNLKKTGRIKLMLISGIFIKNKDARVDLLIVGDGVKKKKVETEVKKMEAEIGTELSYALFETKEFLYRLDMYDKLVRDIIDFPHEIIFQTKELSDQALKKRE